MDELGVEVPDEYIKESTYLDSIKAEKLTYELLKLKEPPTCIFIRMIYLWLEERMLLRI